MNTIPLTLPSGETRILTLPASSKPLKQFVEDKCKYHIPLNALQENLNKSKWPNLAILHCPIGKTCLPPQTLWTGTTEEWEEKQQKEEAIKNKKKQEKLENIKKTQTLFKKINPTEWKAFAQLFQITPLP